MTDFTSLQEISGGSRDVFDEPLRADELIDLFTGPESVHRKAICKVVYAGVDVTDRLDPFLISIEILDRLTGGIPQCHLELDDREGRLPIPPPGDPLIASLGWRDTGVVEAFSGEIKDVESGFARKRGGRRLWVDATGGVEAGKSIGQKSWGEGAPPGGGEEGQKIPVEKILGEAGKMAGYNVNVGKGFENATRDHWAMMGESFHHFADRLGRELGGVLHISGKTASFLSIDDLRSNNRPGITAEWGVNLISWRLKPFVSRPEVRSGNSQFFNIAEAVWKNMSKSLGAGLPGGLSQAIGGLPSAAPNKSGAEQQSGGQTASANQRMTLGYVIVNGNPTIKAGARITIIGARPGVDGSYTVMEASHLWSRRGYITKCELGLASPANSTSWKRMPRWDAVRGTVERKWHRLRQEEIKAGSFEPTPAQRQELDSGISFPEDVPGFVPAQAGGPATGSPTAPPDDTGVEIGEPEIVTPGGGGG